MDKARFVEVAPHYYALAVIAFFIDRNSPGATRAIITQSYYVKDAVYNGKGYFRIPHVFIFQKAIALLSSNGLLEVLKDDFGPDVIRRSSDFNGLWMELVENTSTIYGKYHSIGDLREDWLFAALDTLSKICDELGVTPDDFERPEVDWKPIPLDRDEPELAAAIEAVSATIDDVKNNNEYASAHPQERAHVLDGLSGFRKRLQEAHDISLPYIRTYAVEPIRKLLKRFGGTATEISISLAKEAIKAWITRKIGFDPFQ